MPAESGLQRWLRSYPTFFVVFSTAAGFATYFCMYAFRKPYAAAEFVGADGAPLRLWGTGVHLKTAFVVSQVVGYAASKFIGIKICSEVTRRQRAVTLVGLVLAAELALLLFAVVPPGWKVLAIFLNGLPLGMVWGLVVWYLEGRRTSELLLAGLSCSYIVSSGVVKSVGLWLMADWGVGPFWMPFLTGLIFLGPYLVCVWLLNQVPDPDAGDVAARTLREPMDGRRRASFLRRFLFGMVLLFVVYFFLTAYRDIRDNFGREIFAALGYRGQPAIFARSELPVGLGVMAVLSLLVLVRDNRWGLFGAFAIMTAGCGLLAGATLLLDLGYVDGLTWMILTGLGAYLTYVPHGSVLFDRIIASTRVAGTAVFAIYVADAVGYTGSVGVMVWKDLLGGGLSYLDFMKQFSYFMAAVGGALLAASAAYFLTQAPAGPGRVTGSVPPAEFEANAVS